MTTDLSRYDETLLPSADVLARQRYAIIVADWNKDITFALAQGAIDTLLKHGVGEQHISITHVPGTIELTYAAKYVIEQYKNMIHEKEYDESVLDEAIVFMNTSKQAARIKCATIGWDAMNEIINDCKCEHKHEK